MNVEIISCEDRARWMEAFDRLPDDEKDVHWLPQYVDAHRQHRHGYAYIVNDGEDASILPFVADSHSVGSPYGYGGLIGEGPFGIPASASYRCHPLFGEQIGEVEKHVVILDLDCDDLRARLSKGHKAAVKRAEKSNMTTMFWACSLHHKCTVFSQLYDETMRRHSAPSEWSLGAGHFEKIAKELGDRADFFFTHYIGDDEPESACLVLHGFNAAYYHFAGNRRNVPGASHLMVLNVAEWAQKQGYRWLHLGGGVTAAPDDPLLIFKKGFGGRLVPVHRYNGEANGAQTH